MRHLLKRTGIFFLLLVSIVALSGCGTQEAASSAQKIKAVPAFSTKDLKGNTVTQEIFAKKKLTVVNVWGTFCPPCIGEMPELGAWAREMPEDVQIIGLICDVEGAQDREHLELARKITSEARADFVNIYPDEALYRFLSDVEAVPTTFFVDSNGQVVGEPIIGANVAGYRAFVESRLK